MREVNWPGDPIFTVFDMVMGVFRKLLEIL